MADASGVEPGSSAATRDLNSGGGSAATACDAVPAGMDRNMNSLVPGYDLRELIHERPNGVVSRAVRTRNGIAVVIKLQHFDERDPRDNLPIAAQLRHHADTHVTGRRRGA